MNRSKEEEVKSSDWTLRRSALIDAALDRGVSGRDYLLQASANVL